jgi:fatty-acid desaturase
MTTTHTTRFGSTGIAYGPILWIGVLHVGALLAFVPGYFSWSALAVCLFLHWLTGSIGIWAGTTTTTPSRPRPGTASGGGSLT